MRCYIRWPGRCPSHNMHYRVPEATVDAPVFVHEAQDKRAHYAPLLLVAPRTGGEPSSAYHGLSSVHARQRSFPGTGRALVQHGRTPCHCTMQQSHRQRSLPGTHWSSTGAPGVAAPCSNPIASWHPWPRLSKHSRLGTSRASGW